MPAPRKQSPSSPATSPAPGGARTAVSPAVAARIRQLAAQAEHRRAIAEYRAHHAIDQQERINALLLELIDTLVSLFSTPAQLTQPPHHQPAEP